MAEKKISELNGIGSITGSNPTLVIVQGGDTLKVDASVLAVYASQWSAKTGSSNTFAASQTFNGVINATNNLTVAGILSAPEINALNVYTSSINTNLLSKGLVSSSAQIASNISGSFTNLSSSVSTRLTIVEAAAGTVSGLVSSSAQITELQYIHSTTSSLNTFSGSIQSEVNALKIATSSYVANSLTSSFVSYGILSQSFANFTSSANTFTGNQRIVGQLQLDNSNNHLDIVTVGGNEFRLTSETGYGIYFNASNARRWYIDGTTFDLNSNNSNYDIVRDNVRVFDSLAKIHTYTGSLRSEVNLIEAYTSSLKTAFSVTESMVNFTSPITSSFVTISDILKLKPTGSLLDTPLSNAGMVMASSSYGFTNLYLFDGSAWKLMLTGSVV